MAMIETRKARIELVVQIAILKQVANELDIITNIDEKFDLMWCIMHNGFTKLEEYRIVND